jgi:hypothetical protein
MARFVAVDAPQDRSDLGVGSDRPAGSQQSAEHRTDGGVERRDPGEMQCGAAADQPDMKSTSRFDLERILPCLGQAALQVSDQHVMQAFLLGDGTKGGRGAIIPGVACGKAVKGHTGRFFAASKEWKQCREGCGRAGVERDPQRWRSGLLETTRDVEAARPACAATPRSIVHIAVLRPTYLGSRRLVRPLRLIGYRNRKGPRHGSSAVRPGGSGLARRQGRSDWRRAICWHRRCPLLPR